MMRTESEEFVIFADLPLLDRVPDFPEVSSDQYFHSHTLKIYLKRLEEGFFYRHVEQNIF